MSVIRSVQNSEKGEENWRQRGREEERERDSEKERDRGSNCASKLDTGG